MKPDQKLYKVDVKEDHDTLRLRPFLQNNIADLSSRHSFLVIKNGLVSITRENQTEQISNPDYQLQKSDIVTLDFRHGVKGHGDRQHQRIVDQLKVVYDDQHLVVVDKASGVLVQPVETEGRKKSADSPPVVEMLKHYWKSNGKQVTNPYLVQRLDKETSGLLVLAKSPQSAKKLQEQISKKKTFRREYLAIVQGTPSKEEGTWESNLGMGTMGMRQTLLKAGKNTKKAITHYKVLEKSGSLTLMSFRLETGRTHQIRIHCAEAGIPVLFDPVYPKLLNRLLAYYAKRDMPKVVENHPLKGVENLLSKGVMEVKTTTQKNRKRMALHAARVVFKHPANGKQIDLKSDLPESLQKIFKRGKP